MKLALVTDGIYPHIIGGMQKHTYYLAKYLAVNKVHIELYHTSNQPLSKGEELYCFTDEEKKYINSFLIEFPEKGKLPGHYIRRSYRYSQRIYKILRNRLDVDFIYVNGFSGWKLIEEKRKGKKLPPIGVNFHGFNMYQRPASIKSRLEFHLFRPAVKFNIKNADYVFSFGGVLNDIINRITGNKCKIIHTPAGVESDFVIDKIPVNHKIRSYLFIGRYERVKGIEELMESLNQLVNNYEFNFHFVGPIPENLRIKSAKIHYWGLVMSPDKLKEIIGLCDILICPSYSEGMPVAIMEAMARGLAIIATNAGAVNKMVDDSNGWLIERCSVNLIKNTILETLREKEQNLTKKKVNSINRVKEELLWEKNIQLLLLAIKTILST